MFSLLSDSESEEQNVQEHPKKEEKWEQEQALKSRLESSHLENKAKSVKISA